MVRRIHRSLKCAQPARVALLLALTFPLWPEASFSAPTQELPKHIRRLNDSCLKAFERLAVKYDQEKDPEAAHFFASCALGFGSKDSKVASIKGGWEIDVYVGKARGGKVLERTGPIQAELRRVARDYEKAYEPYLAQAKNGSISNANKQLLHMLLTRFELARGAREYIKATQRFNELRRGMGLRAVLWDYETSASLILACWYMGETGDFRSGDSSQESAFSYSPIVEKARSETSKIALRSPIDVPDSILPFALVRQDLLNPNARRLWLAHWQGGKRISPMTVYAIPQLPYREDIPTPSRRFSTETVEKPFEGWVDTESTITIEGKRYPYVSYPNDGATEVSPFFSNGKGGMERGWAKSEHDTLKDAGIPIMIRFYCKYPVTDIDAEITESSDKPIPARIYTNKDERINTPGGWATLVILPERHLPSGRSITVNLECSIGPTPFKTSWSFTTAR